MFALRIVQEASACLHTVHFLSNKSFGMTIQSLTGNTLSNLPNGIYQAFIQDSGGCSVTTHEITISSKAEIVIKVQSYMMLMSKEAVLFA